MTSLRHPIGRVRGLGSAKEGSHHWLTQRLSSIALAVLSIWFVVAALKLVGGGYAEARVFAAQPWNAALLIAFVLTLFHHAKAGIQVVIEDYVHTRWLEVTLQIANLFVCLAAALVAVFAVVRIALGA
jgi:succinate dehydrogenase / fumarate reductase, membrane anchor subunit